MRACATRSARNAAAGKVQPADADPVAERRQPGDQGGAGEHREPQVRHEQVPPLPLGEGRAPALDPPPILVAWGHVVRSLGRFKLADAR